MNKRVVILFFLILSVPSGLLAQDDLMRMELKEATVQSTIDPIKLARNIANNFSSDYCPDYVSEVLHFRAIKMNDAFYEFNAYKGIYGSLDFNQSTQDYRYNAASKQYFAPLTVMRSFPWNADHAILKYSGVYLSDSSSFYNMLSVNYQNNPTNDLMLKKRTIEVASPLNPKMVRFYEFEVEGFYENYKDDQIVKLSFKTKPRFFPSKITLLCKGEIYYNTTTRSVEFIKVKDHVDFYSLPEKERHYNGKLSTTHTLSISYRKLEGRVFTSKVILDLRWIDPQATEEEFVYSLTSNSRPSPYENKLCETEVFLFENFIPLDRSGAREVKSMISSLNLNELYCAFYKTDFWKDIEFEDIERSELEEDLLVNRESLEIQARKNGISGYEYYWNTDPAHPDKSLKLNPRELKFPQEYYIYTRTFIYPQIFKKQWQ